MTEVQQISQEKAGEKEGHATPAKKTVLPLIGLGPSGGNQGL